MLSIRRIRNLKMLDPIVIDLTLTSGFSKEFINKVLKYAFLKTSEISRFLPQEDTRGYTSFVFTGVIRKFLNNKAQIVDYPQDEEDILVQLNQEDIYIEKQHIICPIKFYVKKHDKKFSRKYKLLLD